MSNRLSKETSPYLLQHKENPVDWYPWGKEALERAQKENKPILLSVGYSACHWCHVMEHESFENPKTAELMNQNFINIKVDREERPDLDQVYQNVAQAMTRGGGWPLTVFLTPELKPFYGGTYFPPEDKYGRPGFPRVLQALSDAFKNDLAGVTENAQKLTDFISSLESITTGAEKEPSREDFQKVAEELVGRIDWRNGGLGGAPKFPNPMTFAYLWRFGVAADFKEAREAVVLTLTKMASGGIYDQLGGGFSRYSVDESWSVPHFEKMLYDNSLLLKLYSEVLLTNGNWLTDQELNLYQNVILETTEYVFREMTSPEGVFYSAQDADSEGEEGKFFVWDLRDLEQHLDQEEASSFALRYGVTESGNFEHGKTVLYVAKSLPEIAQETGLSEKKAGELLRSAREKLFAARSRRIAPGLDNKVLTSWNGLMISGLAWSAQALRKTGQTEAGDRIWKAAEKAFSFLRENLVHEGNRLSSTFQGGKPKGNAYLDDYAFMAMAALDLSRFTQNQAEAENYLKLSEGWLEVVLNHFKDPSSPGYFFTSDDHEVLIQRPKTVFDQAIPSGTAVTLTCLLALGEMGRSDSDRFEEEAKSQLFALFGAVERNPYGMGELLCSSLLNKMGPVTVSGSGAATLSSHPHVFQKPLGDSAKRELLICHRRSCSLPLGSLDDAQAAILSKLRLP